MAKKSGLGKGLNSLFELTAEEIQSVTPDAPIVELDVGRIHRNVHQPRVVFDEDDLQELSASIRQVGVLQPLVVRPVDDGYEIIAGERRYQAACKAGLKTVPVVVCEIDDDTSLEWALIENIQRSDLNSIEEARAYQELLERLDITQEELAQKLSRSRSAVTNTLRLLDLPDEVQQMVLEGSLTAGHARALLGIVSSDECIAAAEKVVREHLSVRQTEALVARMTQTQATAQPRAVVPASFKKIEQELTRDLDAHVKIRLVRRRYKIEIDVADQDDLERLASLMKPE